MLSIGNFSKIAHITTKTLRYYDEIGLLKPVHVDNNTGYRFYDVSQLKDILLINKLKIYGFSLKEISKVLDNPKDNKFITHIIRQKEFEIKQKLASYSSILKQIQEDIFSLERGNHIMSYLDNIKVKSIEMKSMNILSIREKINVEDYGKYLGKLYEIIKTKELTPVGAPMSIYHGENFDPENYDMEIAVPVKEITEGTRTFPGGLCATVIFKGEYSKVTSVYSKIREWMETKNYIPASAPFDIYATDPSQTPAQENITEIYFPVKNNN